MSCHVTPNLSFGPRELITAHVMQLGSWSVSHPRCSWPGVAFVEWRLGCSVSQCKGTVSWWISVWLIVLVFPLKVTWLWLWPDCRATSHSNFQNTRSVSSMVRNLQWTIMGLFPMMPPLHPICLLTPFVTWCKSAKLIPQEASPKEECCELKLDMRPLSSRLLQGSPLSLPYPH